MLRTHSESVRPFLPLALSIGIVLAAPARAQSLVASGHASRAPVARAAHLEGSITIDGKLDEAAWQHASPITGFRQYQPSEGAPATVPTEVRILYDDKALYIAARMSEPEGRRGIRAPLARRDQLLDGSSSNGAFNSLTSDKFVVSLDPYHNHVDEARFEVNPVGVRGDQLDGDGSWDPIWESATQVDDSGWTAEMRIPFSQLRFSRDTAQHWGLQFWRYEDRLNERDMWAPWRRNEAGGPAYFGHLDGVAIGDRTRQFELLPYILSSEQLQNVPAGDPFHGYTQTQFRVGGDLKYLLTSNLTLDATIHPDFGQVEVDPATLNLSAFETFYDEKRPFFIAGSSAFSFGGMNCMFCSNTSSLDAFYSRRIGRLPQLDGYVDSLAQYDNTPTSTSILGAAKVTGRTAGGYTVGLLDAVTDRERAQYMPVGGGPALSLPVEPLSNYFVGRVKKDFNQGATSIGTIVTSTARALSDTALADRLRRHAEAVGLDWTHAWGHRDYSWIGSAIMSNVAGSPGAIFATQQSSAHYFQRPDRSVASDGLFSTRYDSLATSLRGYGFYTRLAKDNGNWIWETSQNWRSPGFEVNDVSFLSRADYKWMNANFGRQWTVPTTWYRRIYTTIGGQQQFNYDGLRTDAQLQAYYAMEFPNYWNLRSFYIWHPDVYDDHLTRGGPVVQRTGYGFEHVEVSTDPRARAVGDLAIELMTGINSGVHELHVSPGVAFKPVDNVFVQLAPTFNIDEDAAQYVTTVADSTATAFYGSRYVFSFIKTRALSLDTRVNWTFTPNLTLQLFLQPFIASGAYTSFREFAAPRSISKLVYGRDIGTITRTAATGSTAAFYTVDPDATGPAKPFTFDDPDFTSTSLRGNAVLRWEYRPGSTVFFVWTQERSGSDTDNTFDAQSAASRFFRYRPTNIFQIKVNFWIGR